MIPILYESNETAFVSNGLGRLRDCISCVVTEERNGIYECDFEYPIDGVNYDRIQCGRIIAVEHDESDDVQPFDIVSFTKPIDGVVTFHAVHVSYRQSYLTVKGTNINSLSSAFTLLGNATPSNPFTYWTDKTSTGYLGCMDGVPKTVRQTLGGIEGSILDAYGGEYEWDTWTVKLWQNRGTYRDFSIRYGVNMLDYNEEYDSSGCYSSCIPYWTDGTTTVVGDKQTNGGITPSGREQCVPLDVSEKFESQPTKAQVNSMGLSVMNSANPTVPSQNIKVSFVRLQDMGEFADFQNLLQCKLCDTINVIFPDFNSSGTFKIVKTVWNVLTGKYDEMELGDLSISLSEALGINDIQRDSKSTIEQILSTGVFTDSNDDVVTDIRNLPISGALTGGTGVYISNSGAVNTYYRAKNTTEGQKSDVSFGVGNGGTNHGVYSNSMNRWLIFGDGAHTCFSAKTGGSSYAFHNLFQITSDKSVGISCNANAYNSGSVTATKSGYYPIAITGYDITGTGSGSALPVKMYFTSRSVGSCTIFAGLKNQTSSSTTLTFKPYILWVCEI